MIHGGSEWSGRNQSATLRVLDQRGELCRQCLNFEHGRGCGEDRGPDLLTARPPAPFRQTQRTHWPARNMNLYWLNIDESLT